MNDIKPFSKMDVNSFYRHDVETIEMAYRLSSTIQSGAKDIKCAGNEVEIAVRRVFAEKLAPKYHVCDGHIVDKDMTISQQIDIVISESGKSPVISAVSDNSEFFYYEPVCAYAEVKKSFYSDDLLTLFSKNLKRFKTCMRRDEISPNVVDCSNSHIQINRAVTNNPMRNMLFTFMFFVSYEGVDINKLRDELNSTPNCELPNMLVFLDYGVIVNVDEKLYQEGKTLINLYPETTTVPNRWVAISWDDHAHILAYAFMILQEHLNQTVVDVPDLLEYAKRMFNFTDAVQEL